MSATDYIADVTANLTEWGITYRETTEGISVGNIHLEIAEDGYRPAGTILDDTETVAVTSDADKAAALLAFPLARRAWELGYTGDFDVTYIGGEVEMTLSYGSSDLTISAGVNEADRFTITEHDLFGQAVVMSDLEAALDSTQLAYQDPEVAWRVLCAATDFEHDDWETLVEHFHWQARFDHGYRFTKVSTSESDNVALVEDWSEDSPVRVIDVDTVTDVTYWALSDVAAAVLHAIS
jgi:hypothetical protein|uniref:Uncharacterized protein n=1 Tax=Siphoviridae sp. ctyg07 TaxID=2825747 RepID=A0A8S5VCK3_9CAUD|nr:MAG TPA: hypothetical protein [Siphoviridae sp. ctyg07]